MDNKKESTELMTFTLYEISHASNLSENLIIQMIEEGLFHPLGKNKEEWIFDVICMKKAKLAASFYHDLEINMSGIALALELMDRIETLENELKVLKEFL